MLEFISSNPIYSYFFVFFARVIDVSLDVFRLLLLTRGYALAAAVIGFFEVSVFVLALGTVIADKSIDIIKVIAYAGGFATGNLIGAFIEDKAALGYVAIQIFPHKQYCDQLTAYLRKSRYGVTKILGEGRTGAREMLIITTKRKDLPHILRILDRVAPDVFFSVSDIRAIRGGIFPRRRP
jgi:uncharacterized protein YebE (UPF0316 family)